MFNELMEDIIRLNEKISAALSSGEWKLSPTQSVELHQSVRILKRNLLDLTTKLVELNPSFFRAYDLSK